MSGALVELVSKGAQDAYLTGKPEVSFFHQTYKRHTNFSQKPVKLDFIGTCAKNQMVTLKIPRKGDLLGYIFMDMNPYPNVDSGNITAQSLFDPFAENPTIFELYIGGQLIDRQDGFYMNQLWQKFLIDSSGKNFSYTTHYDAVQPFIETEYQSIVTNRWVPLHFFFCDSMCHLPLVALQYHEVEIRITFGPDYGNYQAPYVPPAPNFYANYILLDTVERDVIVNKNHELLIEQVQRIAINSANFQDDSNVNVSFDLSYLNHPVKCLLWGITNYGELTINDVQLYLNGTEVFESPMPDLYFCTVQSYYHSEFDSVLQGSIAYISTLAIDDQPSGGNTKMYSFALKANKHQPCGTCNFSRLDNASLTGVLRYNSGSQPTYPSVFYLWAVNFNVLRIKNGLAGLMFSN
jgi:hypothetical protein